MNASAQRFFPFAKCRPGSSPAAMPQLTMGILVLVIGVIFFPVCSFAQSQGNANLRGTVTDERGAVIADATVTAINDATQFEQKTVTTTEGLYQFSGLNPGSHTLKIEAANFAPYTITNLEITSNSTRGFDVTLKAGSVSEAVTITGDQIEEIKAETGAKEYTLNSKQIDNLSIIGRSSFELLRVLPGVVYTGSAEDQQTTGFSSSGVGQYNVNGLQGYSNEVKVDGSKTKDLGSDNGSAITANTDVVQEVTIQTSNFNAEYGNAGIIANAITKGGSNNFHGVVYDYVRNWRLNANDRSSNYSGSRERTPNKYQYPGGNIGGPVYLPKFGEGGKPYWSGKNKLFFFYGYELSRQILDPGAGPFAVTPTLKMRQGDFSELLTGGDASSSQFLGMNRTVGLPGQFVAGSNVRVAAPGNNISSLLTPEGTALMKLFPLPNYNDPSGRYNYRFIGVEPHNRYQHIARFDYNLSDKTRIFLRLSKEHEDTDYARGLWASFSWAGSSYELQPHAASINDFRSGAFNITSAINPTLTNELLLSATSIELNNLAARDLSAISKSNFGLRPDFLPWGDISPKIPGHIGLGPLGSRESGLWGAENSSPYTQTYQVSDNLTKVYNNHAAKFGFSVDQSNKEEEQRRNVNGDLNFSRDNQFGTGNEIADLLTGHIASVSQANANPRGHFRYYNIEAYVQDSWKVRQNFTLEYGVRMGYFPNHIEINSLGVTFDPKAYVAGEGVCIKGDCRRPNGFVTAARGQIPKGIVGNPKPTFNPRLNFAWNINGKSDMVIRGGIGMFTNRPQSGWYTHSTALPPNSFDISAGSNDLPGGLTYNNLRQINPETRLSGTSFVSGAMDLAPIKLPRVTSMSLSLAKRLPFGNVLEASYVGNVARNLQSSRSLNHVPLGALSTGKIGNTDLSIPINRAALDSSIINNARPFPAYSGIFTDSLGLTSAYNSLQATLSHQTGKTLQYFVSYTFSKAMGSECSDPIDIRRRCYGILSFDRTHILNASYNYQIPNPFRHGFDNRLTRGVFGGWQLSGISTFTSGTPVFLSYGGALSDSRMKLAFFGTDEIGGKTGGIPVVYLGNPSRSGSNVGDKLFDLSQIGLPKLGQEGPSIPPFYLRSPSRNNHDVTFFKNFNFSETRKIQFRAGLFNVFNQAFPNQGDVSYNLNTECLVRRDAPNGVGGMTQNVCDPLGGFKFTEDAVREFGRINTKHGRRIVELALKFYF